jgi:Uri superfamily endonuclease
MTIINRSLSKSRFLILFFLCSSVPFIAAKLALEFGWFSSGVKNKGHWLERDIQLLPATEKQQHWHLVYVQAQQCDASCELALYTLQQLYIGLGRKQEQISALILADQAPAQLANFPVLKWQTPLALTPELQNQILIVNQKGLVLLRYPVSLDPAGMLIVGKDIRTDLLHLMNYDRVGA